MHADEVGGGPDNFDAVFIRLPISLRSRKTRQERSWAWSLKGRQAKRSPFWAAMACRSPGFERMTADSASKRPAANALSNLTKQCGSRATKIAARWRRWACHFSNHSGFIAPDDGHGGESLPKNLLAAFAGSEARIVEASLTSGNSFDPARNFL
jgi:hypothetical protein